MATDFREAFRAASPYIHAHRGRIFVVFIEGQTFLEDYRSLVEDLILLYGLGIKLVIVYGLRPQIERLLQEQGMAGRYHLGLRVTDRKALECAKEAAGIVRIDLEAAFSQSALASPMRLPHVPVVSGNFVVAKPIGVRRGIDFRFTGEVRRIERAAILKQLDAGHIVLVSPLGYAPTGEVFNLESEAVATEVAIALKADKLLILMDRALGIPQLTSAGAESLLHEGSLPEGTGRHLRAAIRAVEGGVDRVHLLDRHVDGALLLELFTPQGVGTLVTRTPLELLRRAQLEDIPALLLLLEPLAREDILISRSRERLEEEIGDYLVLEQDGLLLGCIALHSYPELKAGRIAALAVHPEHRRQGRGERLLRAAEAEAKEAGLEHLYLLTTHAEGWFRERGYETIPFEALPEPIRRDYSPERGSKILHKSLVAP